VRLSLRRETLSPEQEAQRRALKDAQRNLKEAEKAHERRVKDAKKAYAAAQKAGTSALKTSNADSQTLGSIGSSAASRA
jgi:hypothetical protein